MTMQPLKPTKPGPDAPRTCCETHRDKCDFGRQHLWTIGFYRPDGTFDTTGAMKCARCWGVCVAEVEV